MNKTFILSLLLLAVMATGAAFTVILLDEKQISGTVLDAASGEPIPLAALQVGSMQLVTDRAGHFSTYSRRKDIFLQAAAVGYLPAAFSFDLPWYLKHGRVKVELAPLGLSLKVVDAWTGTPLPGATVQVGDRLVAGGPDGLADLGRLKVQPPVLILVGQAGYLPRRMELARLPQDSTELPLVISLEPYVLTGVVTTADDFSPLEGVRITAGNATAQTGLDGRFALPRIVSGTTISVQPAATFLPARVLFTAQSTVTIQVEPRRLPVFVVDSFAGAPVAGAQVQVSGVSAVTGEEGRVQLSRVPPTGTVRVEHPAYAPHAMPYSQQSPPVVLLRPNSIQGLVRDAQTGQPLTTTRLALNGSPLPPQPGGYYHLPDLTQPLTITVKQPGYKTAQLTIRPAGADLTVQRRHVQTAPCQTPLSAPAALCLDLRLQPFAARAVYAPFSLLGQPEAVVALFNLIERTELNAIVIDVKGDRGLLAWDSRVPQADLLGIDGPRPDWMALSTFIAQAQTRDIYTIARMVVFKDNPLALGNPNLAVVGADGAVWLDDEGLGWANPFREEVWDYNIALAKEIAALGFDEINVDYIRFPSDGDLNAIAFAEENTLETRTGAIRAFISRMERALRPYGVFLSADVFGLTVWVDPENDMNIGQRVVDLAPYVDYLSPMVYPSTFSAGNLGFDDPSAHPYDIIYRSQNAAATRVSAPTGVRPWLQAYWYTPAEMRLQKQAANDAGSAGWVWWNAAGIYDETIFEPE
ncbi:MAG: putative glycoside hydrolase [Anaerolineae bacterium]